MASIAACTLLLLVTAIPPSHAVATLVAYMLKTPTSPNAPAFFPHSEDPSACAASSIRRAPARRAIRTNSSTRAMPPYVCTGTMARVRSVTAAFAAPGSIV